MMITFTIFCLAVGLVSADWRTVDPFISPQMKPEGLKYGDMKFTPEQLDGLKKGKDMGTRSNGYAAINELNRRWPDAVIPYTIDCSIEHLEDAIDAVKLAMEEWENKTCIRFVKRTNEKYFLKFFRNTHCWGNVGKISYAAISVGYGCEYQHVMTHEIGHAVGFYHEQSRLDRDNYIKVHWENMGESIKSAFDKEMNTDSLGVPYDYESIMHYPWNAFTINGKDTMSPIRDTQGKTPYIELSKLDAFQTSLMYNCPVVMEKREKVKAMRHEGDIRIKRSADDKSCVDENQYCPEWAAMGYCSIDPYTQEKCKLSCKSPSCKEFQCVDKSKSCSEWARAGHCELNKGVAKDCIMSCNPHCKASKCVDRHSSCTAWAKAGYCQTNKQTARKCVASCDPACKDIVNPTKTPTVPPTTLEPVDCTDEHVECPTWKQWGHCKINPTVMLQCRKSCNPRCNGVPVTLPPTFSKAKTALPTVAPTKIPDGDGKRIFLGKGKLCLDGHPECASWASKGECVRNPGWMLNNCMLSCNVTKCDEFGLKPAGDCADPLGLSWNGTPNFTIPDSAFFSPHNLSPGGGWEASAMNARLYFEDDYDNLRIGSWCAASHKSAKSSDGYVQVDLGSRKTISHIATQGRDKFFERVYKFKIEYSNDGKNFKTYQETGADKVFDGNCDHVTPVLNKFNTRIQARYIRYRPWEWNYPCVRMELYGC